MFWTKLTVVKVDSGQQGYKYPTTTLQMVEYLQGINASYHSRRFLYVENPESLTVPNDLNN